MESNVAEHHYNKPKIDSNKLLKEASHRLFFYNLSYLYSIRRK
ncbi:hypothetical protein [Neoehrlichia mikurensis]|nr:hypothetical protein [Neoehrlichia mikurensis]